MPTSKNQKVKVPTDKELYESRDDAEVFWEIHRDVITPRLKNIGGFRELKDWDQEGEVPELWYLAMNLLSPNEKDLQCIRLTDPSIKVLTRNESFNVVVFLTRGGGYITAYRQSLPGTVKYVSGTEWYTVSGLEYHKTAQDFLDWWDAFRAKHGYPDYDFRDFDPVFLMDVVRALGAMLDKVEERRKASLSDIQEAQKHVSDIYPYRAYEQWTPPLP